MPTYGYQCIDCKHEFSVFQAMKDDPVAICPTCSGPVKRLLYPVGIVFKGSGWYINDSRKPDTSEKSEAGSSESGSQEKSSSGDSSKEGSKTDSGESSKDSSKDNSKKEPASDKSSDSAKPAPASSEASTSK